MTRWRDGRASRLDGYWQMGTIGRSDYGDEGLNGRGNCVIGGERPFRTNSLGSAWVESKRGWQMLGNSEEDHVFAGIEDGPLGFWTVMVKWGLGAMGVLDTSKS
jgi:hypothetical protein